ncbi:MAG TPA: hypothetical protein VN765_02560, partial [Candidatus Acidoferrum sp.]|nr:hypothetical protein [Candidatus Acidoferrum sp.]
MNASAIPAAGTTNLNSANSFSANATAINWPRGTSDNTPNGAVLAILRSAQVGAPYFAQQVSYFFGSVVPQPTVDENGLQLPSGASLTYWLPQPYTSGVVSNLPYYWSPNAQAVFATQAGAIDITWQKAVPANSQPADYATNSGNYLVVGSLYYRLYKVHYIVSGAAVKTPQKMYWTEGGHTGTGQPVTVPQADVSVVNVIYNNTFPQYVIPGDIVSSPPTTNTLWLDHNVNEIKADNVEGRVFVELLGNFNPDGVTRRFLGFEIVDVFEEPAPVDITVNLGRTVPAYGNGQDDSNLQPSPFLTSGASGTSFYYEQQIANSTRPVLWAIHETKNINDFQMYWQIQGVAGLEWPYVFDRYHEVWPADPAAYVHYLRPLVSSAAQAALTAVQMPGSEAATITDQDLLPPPLGAVLSGNAFYTYLDQQHPAHRTLLQFIQGPNVSYERIFSWLDGSIQSNALLATSVATNLNAWNTNLSLMFPNLSVAPYAISNTVNVGQRINAPPGELGENSTEPGYWAGYIVQSSGKSFNPQAYVDPFAGGFAAANLGAIIPVNALPGSNLLEVLWFRSDNANTSLGFQPSYWPSVIGYYHIQWPVGGPEIIMANNAGTGPLDSLQAQGSIYRQADPTQPGYNPNEEHAVMIGGQAYALRDDLNNTNAAGYTSAPYVLINYTGSDGRPAMSVFHLRREAPEEGYLFDYIVNAGTPLQAPMPLPLLDLPVEGAGAGATNYDTAPSATAGDLPAFPVNSSTDPVLTNYPSFTFQDRKHSFWVYRGLNAGLPALASGAYNSNSGTFGPLPAATAVVNQPFAYYIHVSRVGSSMTIGASPSLPGGLTTSQTTNGLSIIGTPSAAGSNTYTLTIIDLADNSAVSNTLSLDIIASGTVATQGPLAITSSNQYAGETVTYTNRPPFLAGAPEPSNSFTMRFYYVTEEGFDWPGVASPPAVGSIVPYLLPRDGVGGFVGDPTQKTTKSLDIVYRPVWPSLVDGQPLATLFSGQTLTDPVNGLPQVRGQSSLQVLYQQSIATNGIASSVANQSVVLYDPTVEKTSSLRAQGLTALPPSVVTTLYEAKYYFQNLPPNLVNRVWFDPATSNLVLQGQYVNPGTGLSYLLLNMLSGADLAAMYGLCQTSDSKYSQWVSLVNNLAVPVYTFHEAPGIPGSYVDDPAQTLTDYATNLVAITSEEQQVDSYAMCATGPGLGYVTFIAGNSINPTYASDPVILYVFRVAPPLFAGQIEVIQDPNPLSESISFQHTSDLAGRATDYVYDWRIAPPVNGLPPTTDPSTWTSLTNGRDITHYTLGGSTGIQSLGDNYVAMRYRDTNVLANPANTNWSPWTTNPPAFAPGWISRVVAGINPFNQTTTDLFDSPVNTQGSVIAEAGHRWEGDVALNQNTITNEGLIEIYETVLHRGEALSIGSGYNYGPANDALLLVTGYLNDLYNDVANDAWANSQNPTISIGTDNATYGNLATALFCFQGEVASLLEQDLALLRGRDDALSPGVELPPVYNRLYWNYTLGINAGEVIYALNYNIQDENGDGVINAADAEMMYPMGHGDAYGHYLTALCNYYSLLMNPNFDWVPHVEAVSILGATVSVNYQDERKFASTSAALARTGRQVFDLTWREGYQPGTSGGWSRFGGTNGNLERSYKRSDGSTGYVTKYWGMDHWATRTDMGAYLNWVVGNAILPPVDPNPNDQGIQKVDRTTVPELTELPQTATQLQTDMDNAEAGFTPLNLSQNAIPFDINPQQVTGANPMTHFEQIYQRALVALNNAVVAFNDAQSVTEEMRQAQNSLGDFQASVTAQELAYNDQLIELYGTPYPDDMGPGQTYPQGYNGPDLIHYTYVDNPDTNTFGGIVSDTTKSQTVYLDVQKLPSDWSSDMYSNFNFIVESTAPGYTNSTNVVAFTVGPDGFFDKPTSWKSERGSIGSIQQAISTVIVAQNALRSDAGKAVGDKHTLDKMMNTFAVQSNYLAYTAATGESNTAYTQSLQSAQDSYNISSQWSKLEETIAADAAAVIQASTPTTFIFGLADGSDLGKIL